jgi:hypothetical protein
MHACMHQSIRHRGGALLKQHQEIQNPRPKRTRVNHEFESMTRVRGLLGISCLLVRRALFPLSSSRPFV